jgi:hypothetical protein
MSSQKYTGEDMTAFRLWKESYQDSSAIALIDGRVVGFLAVDDNGELAALEVLPEEEALNPSIGFELMLFQGVLSPELKQLWRTWKGSQVQDSN